MKKFKRTADELSEINKRIWRKELVRLDSIVEMLDAHIDRARHYQCDMQLQVALQARNEIAAYLWMVAHHGIWGYEDFVPRRVRHQFKSAPANVQYVEQGNPDPVKPTVRHSRNYHDDERQPYTFVYPERLWKAVEKENAEASKYPDRKRRK